MPRLVRRAPFSERIKAHLDPYDFLLWLSEELNGDALEESLRLWSLPIGIASNVIFIICRSLSRSNMNEDDIFEENRGKSGNGWITWIAFLLVQSFTVLSCANALYTFLRVRHYRLFEQPVDEPPATSSARRVRVDSVPASPSPFQYLRNILASVTSAHTYPDAEREVWQISVWDPRPANLALFTLFSPGHVLLYWALLPPATLDARPSVAIFTAVLFASLLSVQLSMLRTCFTQQAKDNTLIHSGVMNEYDTKFVHPNLNRAVRDVATQTRESTIARRGYRTREVDLYTPTTIIKRGFHTNPNPNYAKQYDPDDLLNQVQPQARSILDTPLTITPGSGYTNATTQSSTYDIRPDSAGPDFSSPIKPHHQRERARVSISGALGTSSGTRNSIASPIKRVQTAEGGGRRRETDRF